MSDINRTFDWVSKHDPESRKYPIRSLLEQTIIEKKTVMWQEGSVLDQGSEGACVGFAWTGELLADPAAPKDQPDTAFANSLASSFYQEAKTLDEWPGENYDGTSVLAGAKVMKQKGFINEYRWCFGIEDLRDAVIAEGPVVIGIPWFEGMYTTKPEGLVKVSGAQVGGHAILITGYNPKMRFGNNVYEVFRWRNSWGSDYGINGSGCIKYKDLAMLLENNGEACVPMQRQVPVFEQEVKKNNETKTNIFGLIKNLFCK
jgi:hypothetical protein